MRPELEHLQHLEYHLLGHSSPTEAAQWQARLQLDPALAAEAEQQQHLYQGLFLAGRQQLRQELNEIHVQLYRPRRTWLRNAVARLHQALRVPRLPARR
ncbi:NifQ protein [Hymenobacter gelipurpurascens]|uniref:NifQ protein n=1 Tax=Hymenobacter gelipurpurascens TaxID=89968 RepID=A0A212UE65_9BACT|nr:nitrogen fixation protein NifQ [Hymenobacter gelipurpurascens]SNC76539.1 NifQ protein [Hymenobacter gelipurpurascens]